MTFKAYLTEEYGKKSKKTIITFGSNHIEWAKAKGINPMSVMIVIDKDERSARQDVVKSAISNKFAFSYPYEDNADDFKKKYNMKEYTLKQILDLRK
jgi:hypothetical protein